ncbi:Type VI secretion, VasB, ImpH, VC_A0111 [Fodinibius roseus]|uniref:Type VI secretion, VasB, ImpH, VC_A0111 n=1 Tax=Fodinibius roseus TaxID=1194090 RepID=A0A1M5A093_9BACT|nr:type VI secretion system baseplate subunit TssG [Fodinibius roseus]SHF23699.1 Type VI secretion, VasB, ImpH, VC_A0111 [Fodinibius roseus]
MKELIQRIHDSNEDIRSEVIVSDLLAGGMHTEDISVRFAGQLKRPRSRDIAGVRLASRDKGRQRLEIILNRDSIYDTLPEGMFHQPSAENPSLSVSSMVEEYHRQQQEEEEARRFFAPFENELFLQRTFTESEEYRQLSQIQHSQLDPSVLAQLGIDPDLPQAFTATFMRILPYLSHIAGDLARTEQLFSLLLDDPIRLKAVPCSRAEKYGPPPLLGDATLGDDLTAGNTLLPDHSIFRLTVGPVSREKLPGYTDEGWKAAALQTLINFVIPVEWEIMVQVEITKEGARSFSLNDEDRTGARLGYTTTLPE